VAAVILGEHFGWLDALGIVVITAGILMVQRARVPGSRVPDNRVRAEAG